MALECFAARGRGVPRRSRRWNASPFVAPECPAAASVLVALAHEACSGRLTILPPRLGSWRFARRTSQKLSTSSPCWTRARRSGRARGAWGQPPLRAAVACQLAPFAARGR